MLARVIYGGMFDGNALIPAGSGDLMVGGGYRIADEATLYGALGYVADRFHGRGGWFVRGLAGRRFYQLHLGAVLNLGTGLHAAPHPTPDPMAASVVVPEGMEFVGPVDGTIYYWTECRAWRRLRTTDFRFFRSREEAEQAGYRPTRLRGCAGPTTSSTPASSTAEVA